MRNSQTQSFCFEFFTQRITDQCEKLERRPNEKEVNSDESAPNPNEKMLKTVNSQEVISLVRTSGRHPAFGNKLRERLRDFETLTKTTQFTRKSAKNARLFEARNCDRTSHWSTFRRIA